MSLDVASAFWKDQHGSAISTFGFKLNIGTQTAQSLFHFKSNILEYRARMVTVQIIKL